MENTRILSIKNVIVFIIILGAIALAIYSLDILMMLFASFVISCAISPLINKMEKKKIELDKKKDEFYQQIKQGLNMKVQGTKVNKNSLTKEADAKRDEILEYESYVFGLVKSKEAGNNNKKILSQCKTIQTQKDEQNRMREFKRIINTLQDDSVTNKNDRQKRRMYNEKVRKELEEKKKEEEKRLEEAGLL